MEFSIVGLVLALAGIWMFWGFIRRTLFVAEQMSLRGLNKLNDEQKLNNIEWYKKNTVSAEDVTKVIANKKAFESLNI